MKFSAQNIQINIQSLLGKNEEDIIIKHLNLDKNKVSKFKIVRKSLDSRFHKSKGIFYIYNITFEYPSIIKKKNITLIEEAPEEIVSSKCNFENTPKPIIIGAGPAGLYCALRLVEYGITPIIIEKGKDIKERQQDIDILHNEGILNPNSNVQFGLGGAGTYSDGKLRTRIKSKLITYVLQRFVDFGADEAILYEAKPHLGTDRLSIIISAIKDYLIEHGCEFYFESTVTDLEISDNKIYGVVINNNERIASNDVILCIGNAARDTYEMLNNKKIAMEPKPMAVGVRIEHSQKLINEYIYGKFANESYLPTAEYQLTYRDNATQRSIYTFCNCPGGVVVNSSSEKNMLAINGMSYSKRDLLNANSALVVNVRENDYDSSNPLSAIEFQREIEQKAYRAGGGTFKAPIMNISDFIGTNTMPECVPSIKPGFEYANINDIFPEFISSALKKAMLEFNKKIPGFDSGIITACETRTSSPIRILRNDTTHESITVHGLYPTGEGAGYAGGIVSSAVDGVKSANKIIEKYSK